MLRTETDRLIENTSFLLDDGRFVRCRFVNSQLIYEGRDEIDFEDCAFERCSWTFGEAAGRTIGFLSTLYHKNGNTGMELVEAIFDSIRSARVTEVRASAHGALTMKAMATVDRKSA